MRLFLNAGPSNCGAIIIICSLNEQNSLYSTFPCFFHPHLLKYSYHPVSLSLLCPLSLIPPLLQPSFLFFFFKPQLLYRSPHPIHLTPSPSTPFLFDVSLSFFPVFQPWLFPPSFTITPLSFARSLTIHATFFHHIYPFQSFHYTFFYIIIIQHQHLSLLSLLTIIFQVK